MAVTATPAYPQSINTGKVQILPADASNEKTIATGGANGTIVESVIVTSSDTTTRDLIFSLTNGGTSYPIGTVNIPVTAGQTNAIPSVAILNNSQFANALPWDAYGNKVIYLASGDTLTCHSTTTVTTAKAVTLTSYGSNL